MTLPASASDPTHPSTFEPDSMPEATEGPLQDQSEGGGEEVLTPQLQRPRKNALVIEKEDSEVKLEAEDKGEEEQQQQQEEGETDALITSNNGNNEDMERDDDSQR